MDKTTLIAGGFAGIVGLLIGIIVTPSGPDIDEIRDMVSAELKAAQPSDAPLEAAIAQLQTLTESQGADLGAALGALGEQVSAVGETAQGMLDNTAGAAAAADVQALAAQLEEMGTTLGDAVSATTAAQVGALTQGLSALQAAITTSQTAPSAVPGEQPDAPTQSTTATSAPATTDAKGLTPGETALLADGALRAFVSRVSDDPAQARLSLQGKMITLGVGGTHLTMANDDYCKLSLDAVDRGHAQLSAACGDDLPAPEGLSVGKTALLADGTIRAFVSRVADFPPEARLSINGDLVHMTPGRTALLTAGDQNCGVKLDTIDRGHVTVSATCGADMTVSQPIAPGNAVSLGSGAARIFLSGASEESETVRFAVNGQSLQARGVGGTVALDDGCFVSVESIEAGTASFGYNCDG